MPIEKNGTKVIILNKREATLKNVYIGDEPPTGIIEEVFTNPSGTACSVEGEYLAYFNYGNNTMQFFECSLVGADTEVKELKKSNGDLIHKRVTISFSSNGGVGFSKQTRTWGVEQIVTPPTPTKSGYTFKGWYTAISGGTQVTFPRATPSTDITYYAQWTAVSQTLKWAYKGKSSSKVCFCQGVNMIGSPCSTAGETMTICGADAGTSDRCSILVCTLS